MTSNTNEKTTCVIVGGGPAGMFAGLILARGGVEVVVLEKHGDFLRDFRGDTVHPSTLQLLEELGLYDRFAKIPQSKLERFTLKLPNERIVTIADFTRLPVTHGYIAMVPQWDLLDMLAVAGRDEPSFDLRMNHEVTSLIRDGSGQIIGVRYNSPEGPGELLADLTLVCDGRWSICQKDAGLVPKDLKVGSDIWWLRVPNTKESFAEVFPRFKDGKFIVVIPRKGYFQMGRFLRKGEDANQRAQGVEALRKEIAYVLPELSDSVNEIKSIEDAKLLEIKINRLKKWHIDGLLCIGDAAHAMSPLGGVGINLAVQDAVAASRILVDPLLKRKITNRDLAAVKRRRMFPVIVTQTIQLIGHHRVIDPMIAGNPAKIPGWIPKFFPVLFSKLPWLSMIPARLIGMGVRPEHAPDFARRPSK